MVHPLKCAAVDDDRNCLELIGCYLAESRLEMQTAKFLDAETALETLKHEHVDLVITDLRMPGMDGLMFIAEFRRIDRNTPIIAISSDDSLSHEALARGANAFVAKDELSKQLVQTVTEMLEKSHASRIEP